ncbi:regulator of Ty1 Transposition [Elasticomyces elasticus]|nr:regulator of Ty1 Transposition [Elasticomyces elasticus]KAK4988948.1 regulator of Ty1 Transposition [Elasticomyces elasticus]
MPYEAEVVAERSYDEDRLFYGIDFTIIPSGTLDGNLSTKLIKQLTSHGANYIPLKPDGHVDDVRAHSHIISTHVDFPDYADAFKNFCHVVKPSWVEQSIAKGKALQTRQYNPDPAQFFQDVVITCADLPVGDKDAIIAGVLAMGGLYCGPLSKSVTHIVALTEDNDKCRMARRKQLSCKIVLPHWFDDCLQLGKKISEKAYELPNPEVLQPYHDTPVDYCTPAHLVGAASALSKTVSLPSSPAPTRKALRAFSGKVIMLGSDLLLSDHLRTTICTIITSGGGQITSDNSSANIYIGQYRSGSEYITASQTGKEVANLVWLYHVINTNAWSNPLSQLLHYPVPRHGIDGFQGMRISLSNYVGEARIYLEHLVKAAGANFTKTMKQENTHLITAHKQSEKCDAAQEWNINIVNHLWLEESYAKCEVQALTNKRYTHFPPRTNLGEVVGQIPIDIERARKVFFPGGEDAPKLFNYEKLEKEDRARTEAKKTSPKTTVPASSAATKSFPSREEDGRPAIIDDHYDTALPPGTAKNKRIRSDVVARTPSLLHRSEALEKQTPPTTGSRASKDVAKFRLGKLTYTTSDAGALFAQEKDVTRGKKRTSAAALHDGSEDGEREQDANDEAEKAGARKGRKRAKSGPGSATAANLPSVIYTLMITGDDRWANKPKKESEDVSRLRALGISLTQEPSECTLLCAPRILRTRKFVSAIAYAPTIVATSYLDHVLKQNKLPEPTDHPLSDLANEEKYGLSLSESIQRARLNFDPETRRGRMFQGWTIHVTTDVTGGFDTFKEVVQSNGGTCLPYRGRTGLKLQPRRPVAEQHERGKNGEETSHSLPTPLPSFGADDEVEMRTVYLVSAETEDDSKLWDKFRRTAEKQDLRARIVRTDWLLTAAMSQQVGWDEKWELRKDA